jgi:hypothetical protein
MFSHSIGFFLATLLLVGLIFLLMNAFNATSRTNNQQQTPYYQPSNQTPYYQPSNQAPYYQPSYQQDYQSYDEGYQAQQPSQNVQQSSTYYQPEKSAAVPDYEEYEQPQAQYPEQEPPAMQQ